MKKIAYFFILTLTFFMLCSCNRWKTIEGEGAFITKTYENLEATSLSISNIQLKNDNHIIPVSLYIRRGNEKKIEVDGQKNIIADLKVISSFEKLSFEGGSRTNYKTEHLNIYLYGYYFDNIKISLTTGFVEEGMLGENTDITLLAASKLTLTHHKGKKANVNLSSSSELVMDSSSLTQFNATLSGGSILSSNGAQAERMNLDLSNKSSVNFTSISLTDAAISLSSNSKLSISGSSESLDLTIAGESDFLGDKLYVDNVTVASISGKSSAILYVNKSLNVIAASGQSSIIYYGEASLTEGLMVGKSVVKKGQ